MVAIIDFLYFGEANVNQESLEAFLGLAEELRLKGLTGSAELKYEEYKNLKRNKNQFQICQSLWTSVTQQRHQPHQVKVVAEELDEQINSMMNVTEQLVTIGNQTRRLCTCNVCGKEGIRANIKTHIEANHIISNVSHSCDICGKISKSRNGLRLHKAKEHCT